MIVILRRMETVDLRPQFTQVSERGNPNVTLALLVEEILSKCRELKQLEHFCAVPNKKELCAEGTM